MTLLTGPEIIQERFENKLYIKPFDLTRVGPNSYDLTLQNTIRTYVAPVLDSKRGLRTTEVEIPEGGLRLEPGRLYLGTTVEVIGSDWYVSVLHGRSSAGRLGITAHVTAGLSDLGWFGEWTLEMSVIEPVIIYPNMSICQVVFHPVKGDRKLYSGKYQNQRRPTESRMHKDTWSPPQASSYPIPVSDEDRRAITEVNGITAETMLATCPWSKDVVISSKGEIYTRGMGGIWYHNVVSNIADRLNWVGAAFLGPPPRESESPAKIERLDILQGYAASNLKYVLKK